MRGVMEAGKKIDESTPLVMLTVGDLLRLFRKEKATEEKAAKEEAAKEEARVKAEIDDPVYIYGLSGIMTRYGVGKNTAWRWKNTILSPAVSQDRRVIVINARKADRLLFEAGAMEKKKGGGLRDE